MIGIANFVHHPSSTMNAYKLIQPFSIGMGDRFGHEAVAQLSAIARARSEGIVVSPVWNKSNREHTLIGTEPGDVRKAAEAAVTQLQWKHDFHIDADHINLTTVDRFIPASDFFTLDVADYTGRPASLEEINAFVSSHLSLCKGVRIPGIEAPLEITEALLRSTAEKFLWSMQEAGRIYRHVAEQKGPQNFITEVSVDETDLPQTPAELLLILSMIARENIPVQTIAPKFTGRFNKGVDYVGNLAQFEREFEEDLCVVAYAVREFGLPASLKLSVHSGSDKFSIYPIIRRLIQKHRAGLHVKTAGTNWLEEVIGLGEAGGDALGLAKEIYRRALPRFEELVKPYAPVVDIQLQNLPTVDAVLAWSSMEFVEALRHDSSCPRYHNQFRQFIHVAFKVAAELGATYTDALKAHRSIIARNVTHNLLERHIRPIFTP
jgi:hypothetical protein